MSAPKFTPGPWESCAEGRIVRVDPNTGVTSHICTVERFLPRFRARTAGEGDANARLIAAAPELYEVVGEAIKSLCCTNSPRFGNHPPILIDQDGVCQCKACMVKRNAEDVLAKAESKP